MIKDKIIFGKEFFMGITKFLPENSNSINFIDFDKSKDKFTLAEVKFRDYVRAEKNKGVNAYRTLPWYFEPVDIEDKEGTGRLETKEFFLPHKWVTENKWDLTVFEQSYFDILKLMLSHIADGFNTVLTYPIIDNCANMEGYGAWKHNVNGIDDLYHANSIRYIQKLIDKLLSETIEYRNSIIWELGNETHSAEQAFGIYEYLILKGIKPEMISLGINLNMSATDSPMKQLREMIRKKYGLAQLRKSFFPIHQHLICTGNMDHHSGFGKHVYWAMDEVGSENKWMQRIISDEAHNDIRVMITTDGTGDGDIKKCDTHPRTAAMYRSRPDIARWKKWLNLIFSKYILLRKDGLQRIYIEQFIKKQDPECQAIFNQGVSDIYKKFFGVYPANYGNFPKITAPPEEPIEPPIIIEIPPKEENMEDWKFFNGFKKKFPWIKLDFVGLLKRHWKGVILGFILGYMIKLITLWIGV